MCCWGVSSFSERKEPSRNISWCQIRGLSLRERKDGGHCGWAEWRILPPGPWCPSAPYPGAQSSGGDVGSEHGCVLWRWDEERDKHCLLLSASEETMASHTGVSTGRNWCVSFRSVASANAKPKDSLSVLLILAHIWLTRSAPLIQTSPVLPHTWAGCFAPWVLSLAGPKPCSGETGCVSPLRGTSSVSDSSGSCGSEAVITTRLQLVQIWNVSAWDLAALYLHRNYYLERKY